MRNKDICPNHAPYIVDRLTQLNKIKALVHSSQKPTSKLAARTFIQSQYLKALAASLQVGFAMSENEA